MIVLGLDLATSTGACYGRPDTVPEVEVVRAPASGEDYGLFGDFYLTFFERILTDLGQRLEPGETLLVNYEAPILPPPRWDPIKKRVVVLTTVQTTRKLHFLGTLLEAMCRRLARMFGWAIDCRECMIQAIKNELTGKRNATKTDMIFVARRLGVRLPPGPEAGDGADALGAWLLALRHHAPQDARRWDALLYGRSAPQERLSAAEARKLL